MGVTQFCRVSRGENLFSEGKVTNIKVPGAFFRKLYISLTYPLFGFFWNSPIQMKGGRECFIHIPYGKPHLDGSGGIKECLNSLL